MTDIVKARFNVVDVTIAEVHCALCVSNLTTFGHAGYSGMAELCETDHNMILWDDKDTIVQVSNYLLGNKSKGQVCTIKDFPVKPLPLTL